MRRDAGRLVTGRVHHSVVEELRGLCSSHPPAQLPDLGSSCTVEGDNVRCMGGIGPFAGSVFRRASPGFISLA